MKIGKSLQAISAQQIWLKEIEKKKFNDVRLAYKIVF